MYINIVRILSSSTCWKRASLRQSRASWDSVDRRRARARRHSWMSFWVIDDGVCRYQLASVSQLIMRRPAEVNAIGPRCVRYHLHNAILISSPQHRSCAMYFSLRALIIILRHSNQSLVPSDVQQVYSHQHDDYFSCICIYCSSNQVYSCPPLASVGPSSVRCPSKNHTN